MTKRPDPAFNNRAAQATGLVFSLVIIVPQLMRIMDGRGNGFDVVLLVAGILLAAMWLVIIAIGVKRRRAARDRQG